MQTTVAPVDTGREHDPGTLAGAVKFLAWTAATRAAVAERVGQLPHYSAEPPRPTNRYERATWQPEHLGDCDGLGA